MHEMGLTDIPAVAHCCTYSLCTSLYDVLCLQWLTSQLVFSVSSGGGKYYLLFTLNSSLTKYMDKTDRIDQCHTLEISKLMYTIKNN